MLGTRDGAGDNGRGHEVRFLMKDDSLITRKNAHPQHHQEARTPGPSWGKKGVETDDVIPRACQVGAVGEAHLQSPLVDESFITVDLSRGVFVKTM